MNEATMDSKGRILIPEDMRKELGLSGGSTVGLRLEKGRLDSGSEIVITKSVGPDEFIRRTKGILKKGSPSRPSYPLRLKEIWGDL